MTVILVGTLQVYIRPKEPTDGRFDDIKPYWPQWVVIGCLELLWLCLTFLLPVPGCPTGYIGPGGLHENSQYYNCTGGAARWIDLKFFGWAHIFHGPTSYEVFQVDRRYGFNDKERIAHDPEGLLGSINSIVIVFLGLQAGKILIHYKDPKNRCIRFGAWGCEFHLLVPFQAF